MTNDIQPQTIEGAGLASGADPLFERKVARSALALRFEQLWPRLWLVAGVIILFLIVSLAGVWGVLGPALHKALLALFFGALVWAIVNAFQVQAPAREMALRRLETVSGLPHRPASSYEDQLSGTSGDSATQVLWAEHKARLARLIGKLRVGRPEPRTDRLDPFAARAALVIGLVALAGLVGDSARDRLASAFRIHAGAAAAQVRLDAWLTPPAYTAKPPVLLADGANPAAVSAEAASKTIEIPERSVLVARAGGADAKSLEITIEGSNGKQRFAAPTPARAGDPMELRQEMRAGGTLRIIADGRELGAWQLAVTPDLPPMIELTKKPESSPRGSMKLSYKVEDDYGVASANAKFERLRSGAPDPAKAWAREELKGPRLPLERPPQLSLRLPRAGIKSAEAQTYLELGSHPWAGLPVRLTLEAKDVAGQIGRSEPIEMVLPGRLFQKPLARAIVEQRRKLIDDSRNRKNVAKALAALTLEPEGFIDDTHTYLGLRDALHRLQRDKSRAGLKSVEEQLWHVALRIEDGDLSEAERALRDAQDKLAKALENGASEQEIQQLMQDLKQALNNYLEQLSRQAQNQGQEQQPGQNPNQQSLSQSDLERMMKNIENLAKNGAREQAQQMLSEMRDILERLQAGRANEQQQQQSRQMMQKMDQLGGIVGEQQKLLDDTFAEQKRQGDRQRGRQGQRGQQAQKGQQPGQQGKGQKGQQGEGQQGEPGQQGQPGLGERQQALRDKLDQLQREMRELGMGSDKLGKAQESMENAEQALQNGDMEGATQEQGSALDQMRQGAQQMAQEMMKNMPQRYGQNGDAPRDPLGRPQKSEGPDLGTSVKVPDEIDIQRAREILEELRRRSGEATRPNTELDYLERLLKRF